jgi:hypothetical protein
MSGSKSFDYVFIPRTPGHYTLPAVSFSYFDPSSQTYKAAEGEPQDLQVTPAVSQHRQTVGPGTITSTASSSLTDRAGKFIQDHLEWIFAVLLISGVAGYFWRQNLRLRNERQGQEKETSEKRLTGKGSAEKTKTEPAPQPTFQNTSRTNDPFAYQPVARTNAPVSSPPEPPKTPGMASNTYVPAVPAADPLLEARQFLEEGDYGRFYREVNRAVWKAIQKKLSLPASELNKQNCIRLLQMRGWDETAIISLENILNECEMNLYTPAYDRYNMQQLLRQTEWMVDRLA